MTDWDDVKKAVSQELEELRGLRDELKVQVHLGKAEARQRWEALEQRWEHLEAKGRMLREEAREPLAEIGETAKELAREIRDGYRHLRSLL